MIIEDLGQRDGPMMLFGGPYSNLEALKALSDVIKAQGIAADHVICTGDVVAYGASPNATVAMIRAMSCAVVAGNCEKQLGEGRDHCGCGFDEGSACDLLSAGWYAYADRLIGQDEREWMRCLPDLILFTHQGRRYAVIHGGLSDISRFVWPSSPNEAFEEEIALIQAVAGRVDGVIAGHSGVAFERKVGEVHWINAGVIGLPPNQGKPITQYVILEDQQVHLCGLHYDHHAASATMCKAGLTQGYHETMITGYWPSEDVLSPELRRAATDKG